MAVYKKLYLLSLLLLHHCKKKDIPYLEKQVIQLADSEAVSLQQTNTTTALGNNPTAATSSNCLLISKDVTNLEFHSNRKLNRIS